MEREEAVSEEDDSPIFHALTQVDANISAAEGVVQSSVY